MALENEFSRLFANENLLPVQWTNKNPLWLSPEQKLIQQIIWTTLDDLKASYRVSSSDRLTKQKRERRYEALDWIHSDHHKEDDKYSFSLICDNLFNNPDIQYIRDGLECLCFLWAHTNGTYPQLYDAPSREGGSSRQTERVSLRNRKTGDYILANRREKERKRKIRFSIKTTLGCCSTVG